MQIIDTLASYLLVYATENVCGFKYFILQLYIRLCVSALFNTHIYIWGHTDNRLIPLKAGRAVFENHTKCNGHHLSLHKGAWRLYIMLSNLLFHGSNQITSYINYNNTKFKMHVYLFFFSERGICLPTVSLWLLFVYIEASIRLRELKNLPFNLDLCRPFAAHW